jgi:hypothetical protein
LHVVRLVVADGLGVAGVGVVAGIAIAFWAGKFVEPLLFEVHARDPLVFASVALSMIGVAAVARWGPESRATRLDANVAMRSD